MSFVLWFTAALAATMGAPSSSEASAYVEAVVDVVADGRARGQWIRRTFLPLELEEAPPATRIAWEDHVQVRLDRDGDWRSILAQRPRIQGTVSGPDYIRVVLQDVGWTFVVRGTWDGPVVEEFIPSTCGLCSEPVRFLTDLFAQVDSRQEAGRRLLPGSELAVQPWLDEDGPRDQQQWFWALQNRNARAGYLWWLLREAEVLEQVDEDVVRVQLATGTEDWALVYRDHRWQVDYGRLPEDSALRLSEERVRHWTTIAKVDQETLAYWRPTWRPMGDSVLVDEGALFVGPRALHGDVVVYHQDMGSRWAMIATLDPETGDVRSAVAAPRIPMSYFLPTHGWWDWLEVDLSPDGRYLAVGVQTRIWVLEVETGDVVLFLNQLPRITALSWSPDGWHLASGDVFGGTSLYRGPKLTKVAQARSSGRPVHGFAWLADGLLAVDEVGAVHHYRLPSLASYGVVHKACCGAVRGVDRLPYTGEVVVGCAGRCSPAWLWRWDPLGPAPPEVLADARLDASTGAVSVDPTGRWLVVGHHGGEGAMALWDLREARIVSTFSAVPLRQISWSPEGEQIWAIDRLGRSWRWEVAELLAGG